MTPLQDHSPLGLLPTRTTPFLDYSPARIINSHTRTDYFPLWQLPHYDNFQPQLPTRTIPHQDNSHQHRRMGPTLFGGGGGEGWGLLPECFPQWPSGVGKKKRFLYLISTTKYYIHVIHVGRKRFESKKKKKGGGGGGGHPKIKPLARIWSGFCPNITCFSPNMATWKIPTPRLVRLYMPTR